MDQIVAWDQTLFLLINSLPHGQVSDTIALFFSGIGDWGAIWIFIAVLLFLREEKRDTWFFIPILSAVGIGALVSEWVLKVSIARARPTAEIGALVVSAAGNYSFPSTHATLAFAGAYVLSCVDRKIGPVCYVLAGCIAVSRIYLGVHYPLDIAGGVVLGVAVGFVAVRLEKVLVKKNRNMPVKRKKQR